MIIIMYLNIPIIIVLYKSIYPHLYITTQQQHKLYVHDYNYVVTVLQKSFNISPLRLSILDNERENEIRLQLYQSYK